MIQSQNVNLFKMKFVHKVHKKDIKE